MAVCANGRHTNPLRLGWNESVIRVLWYLLSAADLSGQQAGRREVFLFGELLVNRPCYSRSDGTVDAPSAGEQHHDDQFITLHIVERAEPPQVIQRPRIVAGAGLAQNRLGGIVARAVCR